MVWQSYVAGVNLLQTSFTGTDRYKGCTNFTLSATNLSECPYSYSRQKAESQTAINRGADEKEPAAVDTHFQVSDAVNMRVETRKHLWRLIDYTLRWMETIFLI